MQHSSLRLLPVPESLGARFSMFLVAILLTGVVLFVLTALGMAGRAPEGMAQTFGWVVLLACVFLLVCTLGLWVFILRQVLEPLEQIKREALGEEGASGLGGVAASMRALNEAVRRTQEELDESNRNLRHVEKLAMVGKLAAGVAHSVRNPLTSVKLRLFSLEKSLGADSGHQEDLAVIAEAIRHVDGIVGNFLEFSRRPALKLTQSSPSDVIDGALLLLESRLATFPVSLVREQSGALPSTLYADPDQLREALLNILLNACEAMHYAGTLTVEEGILTRNGAPFVAVRVRDTGPGIAPEHMADLFTPFFSTKDEGTGLGLPIAKSILEEHGGDIEVRSPVFARSKAATGASEEYGAADAAGEHGAAQAGEHGVAQAGEPGAAQGACGGPGTEFTLLLPLDATTRVGAKEGQLPHKEKRRGLGSKHRPDIAAPV